MTPNYENQEVHLPMVLSRNEETVKQRFWPKLARVLANVPFAEDVVAAYYCAFDPRTPPKAKGILLAALAYFIMPFDVVPDFVPQPGQRWNGVWVVKEKETQLRAFLDDELQTMLKQGKIQSIVESYYMPFYAPFVN